MSSARPSFNVEATGVVAHHMRLTIRPGAHGAPTPGGVAIAPVDRRLRSHMIRDGTVQTLGPDTGSLQPLACGWTREGFFLRPALIFSLSISNEPCHRWRGLKGEFGT